MTKPAQMSDLIDAKANNKQLIDGCRWPIAY